jgi:hypothetical protein
MMAIGRANPLKALTFFANAERVEQIHERAQLDRRNVLLQTPILRFDAAPDDGHRTD